jgi:hypothetical protein
VDANTSGSCTKLCPFLELGGSAPVVACFRHSIIVVLPAPFCPTISESGTEKSIGISLCWLKLLIPLIRSFSTEHILCTNGNRISYRHVVSLHVYRAPDLHGAMCCCRVSTLEYFGRENWPRERRCCTHQVVWCARKPRGAKSRGTTTTFGTARLRWAFDSQSPSICLLNNLALH